MNQEDTDTRNTFGNLERTFQVRTALTARMLSDSFEGTGKYHEMLPTVTPEPTSGIVFSGTGLQVCRRGT